MTTRPDHLEPFDESDVTLLDQLRGAYQENDPLPAGLIDWVTVALSLDDIDVQMCKLTSELSALATRAGEDTATTITFENSELTIMLRLEERADGSVRLDGWIAPAAPHDVEIRTSARTLTTQADTYGRFAFDVVPRGAAHLVLRSPHTAAGNRRTTVTQPVIL